MGKRIKQNRFIRILKSRACFHRCCTSRVHSQLFFHHC